MANGYNKQFAISNFNDYTLKAESVETTCGIKSGLELSNSGLTLPTSVEKIFYTSQRHYFYCKDKFIYYLAGKSAKKLALTEFENPTDLAQFKHANESIIIVKDTDKLHFIGRSMNAITCQEDFSILCDRGRIYLYKDNRICFNDIENSIWGVYETLFSNVLYVDNRYGKIIKLSAQNDHVYILTERAILSLNPTYLASDFSMTKICDLEDCVNKYSVCNFDGEMVFLAGDKLNRFDGKSVTPLFTSLDNFKANQNAFIVGKDYCLPVKIDNNFYLYIFDIKAKEKSLILLDGEYISSNGFLTKKEGREVCCLSQVKDATKCKWQSTELTFDLDDEKILCGVKVIATSPVDVIVRGNNRQVKFPSTDKRRNLPTGIKSKTFNLEIVGKVLPVNVQKVVFYYNI